MDVSTFTSSRNKTKYVGKFDIELFNEQTGFYKKFSFEENTIEFQVPLTNMPKGLYVIRLIIDNQIIQINNILIK